MNLTVQRTRALREVRIAQSLLRTYINEIGRKGSVKKLSILESGTLVEEVQQRIDAAEVLATQMGSVMYLMLDRGVWDAITEYGEAWEEVAAQARKAAKGGNDADGHGDGASEGEHVLQEMACLTSVAEQLEDAAFLLVQ